MKAIGQVIVMGHTAVVRCSDDRTICYHLKPDRVVALPLHLTNKI